MKGARVKKYQRQSNEKNNFWQVDDFWQQIGGKKKVAEDERRVYSL